MLQREDIPVMVPMVLDLLTDEELRAVYIASHDPRLFNTDTLGYAKVKHLFALQWQDEVMTAIQGYVQQLGE